MPNKEKLIRRLERILQMVKDSENDNEAYRVVDELYISDFHPFFDSRFNRRLHHIEYKIDKLIERPISSCRMTSDDGDNVMELLIGKGKSERSKGINHLSSWLDGVEELTIADPYFIKSITSISDADYQKSIEEILPNSLNKLELFIGVKGKQYQNPSIASWFNNFCKVQNIELTVFHQEEVHDRVWIKEKGKIAMVVGTSFNGLGNKCAFLLDLDEIDTAAFNTELECIRKKITSSSQV